MTRRACVHKNNKKRATAKQQQQHKKRETRATKKMRTIAKHLCCVKKKEFHKEMEEWSEEMWDWIRESQGRDPQHDDVDEVLTGLRDEINSWNEPEDIDEVEKLEWYKERICGIDMHLNVRTFDDITHKDYDECSSSELCEKTEDLSVARRSNQGDHEAFRLRIAYAEHYEHWKGKINESRMMESVVRFHEDRFLWLEV